MAQFNADLNVVPTQTVGSSPVVIDTSSLAIAKLAEAFTGQFFQEKAASKKIEADAGKDKVLSGVASFIQRSAAAANTKGGPTLGQAKLGVNQMLAQVIANNPSLTSEINKIASGSLTASGLGAGKSEAALRQEAEVNTTKELRDLGLLHPNATEVEREEVLEAYQVDLAAKEKMKRAVAQFDVNQKNDSAVNQKAISLAKSSLRELVVSNSTYVANKVKRINEAVGSDSRSREAALDELAQIETELRDLIPANISAWIPEKEREDLLSTVMGPINTVRKRLAENKTAIWASDRMKTQKALVTEEFLSDPKRLAFSVLVSEIGQGVVTTFTGDKFSADWLSLYVEGKGTNAEEKDPALMAKTKSLYKEFLKIENPTEDQKEAPKKMVHTALIDIVTDNAQGRALTPKAAQHVVDLLADPDFNKKVASGEIVLDPAILERGEQAILETYQSKLAPTVKNMLKTPMPTIGGKPLGSMVDVKMDNGTLKVTLTEKALKERQARDNIRALSNTPFSAVEKDNIAQENKALKGLRDMVASVNKFAVANATMNKQTKTEPYLRQTLENILGGGAPEKEQPPVAPEEEPTQVQIDIQKMPELKAKFDKLPKEKQDFISSLTPEQIRKMVGSGMI